MPEKEGLLASRVRLELRPKPQQIYKTEEVKSCDLEESGHTKRRLHGP